MPWFKLSIVPEYWPKWWQFKKRKAFIAWLKDVQERIDLRLDFHQLACFWDAIEQTGAARFFKLEADSTFSKAMLESRLHEPAPGKINTPVDIYEPTPFPKLRTKHVLKPKGG